MTQSEFNLLKILHDNGILMSVIKNGEGGFINSFSEEKLAVDTEEGDIYLDDVTIGDVVIFPVDSRLDEDYLKYQYSIILLNQETK